MTVRCLAFAALCLAAWPSPVRAQLGPGEQVRRDLESIFQPGAAFDEISPYGQTAARARLRTRPYATPIAGLCRRDEVILDYGGPRPFAGTTRANAVAPYGVTAQGWYRVIREVRLSNPNYSTPLYDGPPRAGECATLDGAETAGWFVAPDAYVAMSGYRAMAAAIAQVAGPRVIVGCTEDREARQACRNALPIATLAAITEIRSCFASHGRFCFVVYTGIGLAMAVTIQLRYNGRGEERIESLGFDYPGLSIQGTRR